MAPRKGKQMTEAGRLKDWVLGVSFSVIMLLVGLVLNDSRERLLRLESTQEADRRIFSERNERIVRLEQQSLEILRRLDEVKEQLRERDPSSSPR
jgi:hypothetical protein